MLKFGNYQTIYQSLNTNQIFEKLMEIKQNRLFMILFVVGVFLALTGATLMFFGIAPIPVRITIGIIGIGLIATVKPLTREKK